MEHIATHQQTSTPIKAVYYEMAAAEFEKEAKQVKEAEETSCSLLLKNLLKTNLKLIKLNEISGILLF